VNLALILNSHMKLFSKFISEYDNINFSKKKLRMIYRMIISTYLERVIIISKNPFSFPATSQ